MQRAFLKVLFAPDFVTGTRAITLNRWSHRRVSANLPAMRRVFDEPSVHRTTPLAATEPRVNWFLQSTRPEAAEGRRVVNDLFSRFPNDGGRMYKALHSDDEKRLLSALDELLVHDLLSRRYRVEYEEGEGTHPDFRLYGDSGVYVGVVEVATLFLRDDWAAEERRHAVLEDGLNARLRLTTHSVDFEVRRWDNMPSVRHMAKWLGRALDDLHTDPGALPIDWLGMSEKVYSTRSVEIAFRFLALPEDYVVKDGDPVVLGGAAIGGCVDSAVRLRDRLDDKAVKYDLRGKPFAIAVGVRDNMCDLGEVYQAITGTPAVVVATGEGTRKGDGFFGNGRDRTDGKHQRVSAIFSIHEWYPGGPYRPRITRFDNPFAAAPFPVEALPVNSHWGVVERTPTSIRADWLVPPVAPIPARALRGLSAGADAGPAAAPP